MSIAATVGSSSINENDYASEVRFGVVMYGGVSLAIYINGVANELYEMACATPKAGETNCDRSTRGVYWKASWLRGSEELRRRYLAHLSDPATPDPLKDPALPVITERTRFVVDVISGTSAGGINGAFLAKALANGQEFAPLKDLWIQEGNIESLLNDEASYQGLKYARNNSPTQSLLNSDRMYVKLLGAFQTMAPAMPPADGNASPLVDELDLYMTTTDIRGAVVPLRLFDEVVYEKRFKEFYHFQYSAAEPRNDLCNDNAPFLAFAARCTSSFPFAFEPMTVADAQRLYNAKPGIKAIDFGVWKHFFTGLPSDDMSKDELWRSRAFGDGGYLDNKPFSYVADALTWRLGERPMERKLIYVEPVPTHPETERQIFVDKHGNPQKPDAIENAFRALNTIPQYETIREDLEAILARNRRIERVERIVHQVEADIDTRPVDPFKRLKLKDGKVPDWSTLDMGEMIDYYGVAFLPYRHLRMTTVTDDIADRLAVWWKIDRRSDRFYALRAMARVWREGRYYENRSDPKPGQTASINQFLADFDVKYRLRRAGFLLRKVHLLRGLAIKLKQGKDGDLLSDVERRLLKRLADCQHSLPSMDLDAIIAALNCLAAGFGKALQEIRATVWMPAPPDADAARFRAAARETLNQLLGLLLGERGLSVLHTSTGEPVPIKVEDLPPPSPLHTLQENVFARAEVLFSLAAGASLTAIQGLLEADLAALRAGCAKVAGRSSGGQPPHVADLLGDPRLVPVKGASNGEAATTNGESEPKAPAANGESESVVKVEVDDTVGFCGGALDSPTGKVLREFFAEYYLRFDEYDQMSFPLYYDTGTGEPSTVAVHRVSPEDACSLIDEGKGLRRKLAGTAVANFGAFLDVRWRRNDIMWGRLDGCERLLTALFPATGDETIETIRKALLQEAQLIILREEMQPEGYAQLVDKFTAALAERKEATLKKTFDDLWPDLAPADDQQRRTRTAMALKAVLGDAGIDRICEAVLRGRPQPQYGGDREIRRARADYHRPHPPGVPRSASARRPSRTVWVTVAAAHCRCCSRSRRPAAWRTRCFCIGSVRCMSSNSSSWSARRRFRRRRRERSA